MIIIENADGSLTVRATPSLSPAESMTLQQKYIEAAALGVAARQRDADAMLALLTGAFPRLELDPL